MNEEAAHLNDKASKKSTKMMSRRTFLKTTLFSALGTAAVGTSSAFYATRVEPGWLHLNPVSLTLPRLDPAFDGYRVVQFSDIHIDSWMTRERLAHIVKRINAQEPDLVAFTGDFVTGDAGLAATPDLVATLSKLAAPDGTAAVLGNHDHWTDPDVIRQVIEDSGLVNVSNGVQTVERGDAMLHFGGVDDFWERQDRLDDVLDALPEEGAAVLLAHEPDYADISSASGRFDLQLSGHSHGGQVILPFVGPPVLPPFAKKYPLGLTSVGDMLQYTNRGVGMLAPRVRFNCRPEITIFTLRSASAEAASG